MSYFNPVIIMFKFKALLWVFGRLLKKAAKINPDFVEYIKGKDLTFQIQTAKGKGRHFIVKDETVRSKRGLAKTPTFSLIFKDAATALNVMTSKDKTAFMKAIQDKDLVISGDFKEVMWFQGLTKYLKPKRK